MSKGPGRVERAITDIFTNNPSRAFLTRELAALVYGVDAADKKHHVAVLRAADKVAQRLGWRRGRVSIQGVPHCYYNPADPHSHMLGKIASSFVTCRWYPHWGVPFWDAMEDILKDRPDLVAKFR